MPVKKDTLFFIVDNDAFFRMLYHQHLSNMGFRNNILLENPIECLNKLDLMPAAIFIAFDVIPYDGLEAIKRIKKIDPSIFTFLIVNAKDRKVLKETLLIDGCEYIVKGDNDLEMITGAVNRLFKVRPNNVRHLLSTL